MIKTPYEQVIEFHEKFDLEYNGDPRSLEHELALFRIGFMIEELAEYASAAGYPNIHDHLEDIHRLIKRGSFPTTSRYLDNLDLHNQLDALVDLSYVLNGTAYLQGLDLEGAFEEVHTANMKKVRVENAADSLRNSKFDVIKPSGWTAPDLTQFIQPKVKFDVNGDGSVEKIAG